MNLRNLLKLFSDLNCRKVYFKKLAPNDNSKNQVYFGNSFEILNILPLQEIVADEDNKGTTVRFKSKLNFSWINSEGRLTPAPFAQLILYPDYPEVRFSGFLKGLKDGPSDLMSGRLDNRIFFLGVTRKGNLLGFVAAPGSSVANEVDELSDLDHIGVFKEIDLRDGQIEFNSKDIILSELKRIHNLGWINSKRLNAEKNICPCIASNCGGYTLEAELGITPNGYSEPDFLGWEVKQFGVKNFLNWQTSIVTLMTPEPTGGFYTKEGVESFIRKYGYEDKRGREARLNFGGIHKYNSVHNSTKLKLVIEGWDADSLKITNANGFVGLIDPGDNIAALWAFASLLQHWNRKHAKACYIPSLSQKENALHSRQYRYGHNIITGQGTDFNLVLQQISKGNIYYDPGIKFELAIPGKRNQQIKRRSQFRIKSLLLRTLYKKSEIIDLNEID